MKILRGTALRRMVAWTFCVLMVALSLSPTTAQAASAPAATYRVSVGTSSTWHPWKRNGVTAGVASKTNFVKAFQLRSPSGYANAVTYRVQTHKGSWQPWCAANQIAGSVGGNKAIDVIQIKLTGAAAQKYDVVYRVYVAQQGWMGWTRSGASAGAYGGTYGISAIQVKYVAKNATVTSAAKPYLDLTKTQAIRLKHYMKRTRSLKQDDYGYNFAHGGCCAMSYAVGISILTKKDVNPTKYYRYDSSSGYYLCWWDDGHVGSYARGFNGAAVYKRLLSGKPTLVHYRWSSGQHWVLVVGVRSGVKINKLTYGDFTVIDPRIGKACKLNTCWGFSSAYSVNTQAMV